MLDPDHKYKARMGGNLYVKFKGTNVSVKFNLFKVGWPHCFFFTMTQIYCPTLQHAL